MATKKICSAPKSVGKIFEKTVFKKKEHTFSKGVGLTNHQLCWLTLMESLAQKFELMET